MEIVEDSVRSPLVPRSLGFADEESNAEISEDKENKLENTEIPTFDIKQHIINDNSNRGVRKRKQATPVAKADMNKRGRQNTQDSHINRSPSPTNQPTIIQSFQNLNNNNNTPNIVSSEVTTSFSKKGLAPSLGGSPHHEITESLPAAVSAALVAAEVEGSRLRAALDETKSRLREIEEEAQRRTEIAHRAMDQSQTTLRRASRNMSKILVDQARMEREQARKRMCADIERLGRYVVVGRMQGRWEGGAEEEAILEAQTELEKDKAELEKEKAALRTLKKGNNVPTSNPSSSSTTTTSFTGFPSTSSRRYEEDNASTHNNDTTNSMSNKYNSQMDEQDYAIHESKEHIALVETVIRKQEQALAERELKLHADRILHLKETKTLKAQDSSRFGVCPLLGGNSEGGRYQLLNMIGKGGFSEVFKAYDLVTHSFVAVKIHEIKKEMSEDAKENYVRHTLREYSIHRTLKHRRIVRLYDYFTIDESSFGTVLEYCEGVDIDTHLKAHGAMTEKEARGVMVQLWSALRYLNSRSDRIIHYDLKPGNLMYHKGSVKLTDFGLAKVVENSSSGETVELTSQGAGTYWYLPPECFHENHQSSTYSNGSGIRISNKVDVWSAGVIFYELLFARKPFGHGMSQDLLLRSGTMTSCPILEFPQNTRVSKEAKEYIRQLLTVDKFKRPDVFEASNDPYIRRPV